MALGTGSTIPRNEQSAVIEALPQGRDLVDPSTFKNMQEELAAARVSAAGRAPEPIQGDEELLLEELANEASGVSQLADARAPAGPGEVAALEAQLERATAREEIIHLALRIAQAYAQAAALFVVRDEMVLGLRAAAHGAWKGLDGIMVPLATESLFTLAAKERRVLRVRPARAGLDRRILKGLGREEVREIVVLPIAIRGKVVNVLYADNGEGSLGRTSIGALSALSRALSRTYERLILAQKKR